MDSIKHLDSQRRTFPSAFFVRDGVLYDGHRVVARDVDPVYIEILCEAPSRVEELVDALRLLANYRNAMDKLAELEGEVRTLHSVAEAKSIPFPVSKPPGATE